MGTNPHRRTLGALADRLGIGRFILLPFDERLDVSRRDKPHVMACFPISRPQNSAPPQVSRGTAHGRNCPQKVST